MASAKPKGHIAQFLDELNAIEVRGLRPSRAEASMEWIEQVRRELAPKPPSPEMLSLMGTTPQEWEAKHKPADLPQLGVGERAGELFGIPIWVREEAGFAVQGDRW